MPPLFHINLPLALNLRQDRRGCRIGELIKQDATLTVVLSAFKQLFQKAK